jgi:hypothetical protein
MLPLIATITMIKWKMMKSLIPDLYKTKTKSIAPLAMTKLAPYRNDSLFC